MLLTVRNDSVVIEGYVNAVERKSKPLNSRLGRFVEKICKGAFKRALERNKDVAILLNHDWNKEIGSTQEGNLELTEDNIGLRARATITDPEVIEKARNGELIGWSFGFKDKDVETGNENGIFTRSVKDLDLFEVSILDRRKMPAYDGTLVTVRSDEDVLLRSEAFIDDVETRDETTKSNPKKDDIDYSVYEAMINEMKGV